MPSDVNDALTGADQGRAALEALHTRALHLIDRLGDGQRDDVARDQLLCELLRAQSQHVAPYQRLCRHRNAPIGDSQERDPDRYPALPTDVFRYARVAAHDADMDTRVFRTSGTTVGTRGTHHLASLRLYDAAAQAFARHALFGDVDRMRLVIIAPDETQAPDSSLSYMLSRFVEWFGTSDSVFVFRDGALDTDLLARVLDDACAQGAPLGLLGTSFAFVHAEDQWSARTWRLPRASRLMQTGGFKGKSREVEPDALRRALSQRYGVNEAWIVQEYGMTELSSQMYEATIVDALQGRIDAPRRLIAPGWVRVTPVDPETLCPVADGEVGIARIDDIANVESVASIQTADRVQRVADGFVLLGRDPGSTPRGCSLAMEEAMGQR